MHTRIRVFPLVVLLLVTGVLADRARAQVTITTEPPTLPGHVLACGEPTPAGGTTEVTACTFERLFRPAHPTRVAEALVVPVNRMLARVWSSELVRGRPGALNPRCYADTVNGLQRPVILCWLRTTTIGTWRVKGRVRPGRCPRPYVLEDFSLAVTVPTQGRGVQCYTATPLDI